MIGKLVMLDKNWIPREKGYSLYIRPTMIGTQKSVSISSSTEALLYAILSPVGPYYPSRFPSLLFSTR